MKSSKLFLYPFIPLLAVVIIVLSSFGRTIGSYFLEDDLGEVSYVSQIFSGDWQKIITNFTGNYMEIPTMKVYRPCLLLSIIADYSLWKTNACGYFITNILFLIGTAVVLFLMLLELSRSWYRPRSILFAMFSAALFASSPLHCESVSLIVGRVDIICAFFYLLALWFFIRKGNSGNWILTALGVLSFWIALLTKEMAIGLPVVLSAICFLFPDTLTKQSKATAVFASEHLNPSVYQRLGLAAKISYPLWLSLIIYFFIRHLALGTIFGGYIGGIGASQISHIFQKWTDFDTVSRIVFPLNMAVFTGHDRWYSALMIIYSAIAVLVLTRLIISGIPRNWLLMLAIWIITTLVPIYQLWGLGFNLEGARFLFFLTIPLAVLLPLLIFAPTQSIDHFSSTGTNSSITDISPTEAKILAPGIVALLLLVIFDTTVAAKNNIPWIHAGKQTKSLLQEGQNLAQSLGTEQKAIILGIPDQIDGAHVIYNGQTFNFLMSPPFSQSNYINRFITFDPILFGNANLINTSRFKQELFRPDIGGVYVWRRDKRIFEKLMLPTQKQLAPVSTPLTLPLPTTKDIILPFTYERGFWQIDSDNINIKHCKNGTGIALGPVAIDPFAYDFIEIEATTTPPVKGEQIAASWFSGIRFGDTNIQLTESTAIGLSAPSEEHKAYRIALSKYWRWFTAGQIKRLWLEFPAVQSISLKNIRFLSDNSLVPKLNIIDLQSDNCGVYQIDNKGFILQIEASQINNCTGVKLEYSKPNYFFDNFDSNSEQAVLSTNIVNEPSKKYLISSSTFPTSGYYQLRAIGINKNGNYEGEWSDPLTIKFTVH